VPANLSPAYKAAEAAFRAARDPHARLDGLREMLRTIPKHKGTERMQADIKARIKDLGEQLEVVRRGGGHGGPALVVRPEGAAQVALIGPPNAGKSALHARLTGSDAQVAPYPFTTQVPHPGMLPFEDVQFQLLDLPAVSTDHPLNWLGGTLQSADAVLLVVDLCEPAVVDQVGAVRSALARMRTSLTGIWPGEGPASDHSRASAQDAAAADDPFAMTLPTLMLANKAEGCADLGAELEALGELAGSAYPMFAVSADTGLNLGQIGPWLFERLGIVRVYTKVPGHVADRERPFTLRRGQTVGDVARLVHRGMSHAVRYARLWGTSGFDGQQVGLEHRVADRDVIELHT